MIPAHEEPVCQIVCGGNPRYRKDPGDDVEDPALGVGEVVVKVSGEPREQDEEAVVLAEVSGGAGPEDCIQYSIHTTQL